MDILAMDAPATTVRTVAVELQSLTRRFGKLAAGNRINLSISAGAISGLPGTNGSCQAGFHNADHAAVAYQRRGARYLHRHRNPALFRIINCCLYTHKRAPETDNNKVL